jgi:hypothetical protein
MTRLIDAVAAYTEQRGAPPDTLAQLTPGFLSEPAVDPVTGKPYEYTRNGEAVTLVCPSSDGQDGTAAAAAAS